MMDNLEVGSGDQAMIILQSLICYLREKNILSRADLQELRDRVETQIAATETAATPCAATIAAAREMQRLDDFCGRKYGGKHKRRVN